MSAWAAARPSCSPCLLDLATGPAWADGSDGAVRAVVLVGAHQSDRHVAVATIGGREMVGAGFVGAQDVTAKERLRSAYPRELLCPASPDEHLDTHH